MFILLRSAYSAYILCSVDPGATAASHQLPSRDAGNNAQTGGNGWCACEVDDGCTDIIITTIACEIKGHVLQKCGEKEPMRDNRHL